MNNDRRKQLKLAIEKINEASKIVGSVAEDEENAYESMPEGLQDSLKGEDMMDNVESLQEVTETLDELVDSINEVILK